MPPPGSHIQQPHVVVVVLTWNDTEMTSECLESLLESDYSRYEILLVDNGSRTPCGVQLKERFPSIELLVLPENQGFSGGSNRGIERAMKMGADFVHLIGNDSTVKPDTISTLVQSFVLRPDAGAASPLLIFPGEDRIVQFYRATIERDLAHHVHWEYGVPLESREWPTIESSFVPFVAMMFRSTALEQVGLMDDEFCTCWEDYDYCLRMAEADWKILVVGETQVAHKLSGTTGVTSPYIVYYSTRNRLTCLFRHGRPFRSARNALRVARSFYHQMPRHGLTNWACHRAFARGIVDFLLGVRGRGHPPADLRG